jgi:hypothetical protein
VKPQKRHNPAFNVIITDEEALCGELGIKCAEMGVLAAKHCFFGGKQPFLYGDQNRKFFLRKSDIVGALT